MGSLFCCILGAEIGIKDHSNELMGAKPSVYRRARMCAEAENIHPHQLL
jgi:hypothetical protein